MKLFTQKKNLPKQNTCDIIITVATLSLIPMDKTPFTLDRFTPILFFIDFLYILLYNLIVRGCLL